MKLKNNVERTRDLAFEKAWVYETENGKLVAIIPFEKDKNKVMMFDRGRVLPCYKEGMREDEDCYYRKWNDSKRDVDIFIGKMMKFNSL